MTFPVESCDRQISGPAPLPPVVKVAGSNPGSLEVSGSRWGHVSGGHFGSELVAGVLTFGSGRFPAGSPLRAGCT